MSHLLELSPQLSLEITRVIDTALQEDFLGQDLTSNAIVPADKTGQATAVLKEKAVIAGLDIFGQVFRRIDPKVDIQYFIGEGTYITNTPAHIAIVNGLVRSILAGERIALNLLQRLSGIATMTHGFVLVARDRDISILDTRKTTPGLRAIEKYAVTVGGGLNHRRGLFDQILIKDNHIAIAGGVKEAIRQVRNQHANKILEVEVSTLADVRAAVEENIDTIMLDNMSPEQVEAALTIIAGRCSVEVSGGIDQSNFKNYLIKGVDAISIGALTHSVKNIDISLEIEA